MHKSRDGAVGAPGADEVSAVTTTAETKDEKRARLGYVQAERAGKCCLCGRQVAPGQFIGRMPDSWQPALKRRHAHRRCIEQLKDEIRARLGIVVPAAGGDA